MPAECRANSASAVSPQSVPPTGPGSLPWRSSATSQATPRVAAAPAPGWPVPPCGSTANDARPCRAGSAPPAFSSTRPRHPRGTRISTVARPCSPAVAPLADQVRPRARSVYGSPGSRSPSRTTWCAPGRVRSARGSTVSRPGRVTRTDVDAEPPADVCTCTQVRSVGVDRGTSTRSVARPSAPPRTPRATTRSPIRTVAVVEASSPVTVSGSDPPRSTHSCPAATPTSATRPGRSGSRRGGFACPLPRWNDQPSKPPLMTGELAADRLL